VFDADPTPLLFHARDRGDQPLEDTPERRRNGWQRLVLFASYLRPAPLQVPPLLEVLAQALRPGLRSPRSYFGLYPFRWRSGWQESFQALLAEGQPRLQVAPVLERLVFPRAQAALLEWLEALSHCPDLRWVVPAHYDAPLPCTAAMLADLAREIRERPWAPGDGNWAYLAQLDALLLKSGVVPAEPRH
jgi:hypothetical protein